MFIIRKLTFGAAAGALAVSIACSSQPGGPAAEAVAATPAATAATPEVLAKGQRLYKVNCTPCHGERGRGDGPAAGVMKPPPRDHTDRVYMSTLTDEDLRKVIQMGGSIKGKPLMPSNPQIKGADLDALVVFTRSLSASGD